MFYVVRTLMINLALVVWVFILEPVIAVACWAIEPARRHPWHTTLASALISGYSFWRTITAIGNVSTHANLWLALGMITLIIALLKPVKVLLGHEYGIRHKAMHYNDQNYYLHD